ncbi:MAG: GAF domain-containing protein, partial [Oscillospiraceae bacterium]|nr:GAF domain-containing protein [Oscillospiraceae bacterium]
MTDYSLLCQNLFSITEGVPYETANLANASALLWEHLPDLNWAGFYKMTDGKLVLGPFQGKTACIEIEIGRGVCGTAVAENKTQLVYDVHQFPGHIACDCASNSEIVVPIQVNGKIWGVLDIDSPVI